MYRVVPAVPRPDHRLIVEPTRMDPVLGVAAEMGCSGFPLAKSWAPSANRTSAGARAAASSATTIT
jgi:hypothetical protein